MTRGAEINFEGAREICLCEFKRCTGAREIYPSLDQMNKMKTKIQMDFPAEIRNPNVFSGRKQVISKKKVLIEIQRDFPADIRNSNGFSGRKQVISKKKRSSSQKCNEIRCQSTKILKTPVANTNLGLDLHSSSPERVNFFGALSSLGGAQFLFGGHKQSFGGHGPGMPPPRGAGPA